MVKSIRAKTNDPDNKSHTRANRLAWLAVVATVVFIIGVRAHLLQLPLERDEGEYAYMGQLMLQGVPPYSLAFNMKLPGTYAAYAAAMALFGQTASAIHLGLLIINAATVVMMFLLGRRLYGAAGGVIAAVSYAVMSVQPAVLGLSAHATHFVVLFAVAAMLVLLRAIEDDSGRRLALAGLLMGIAFLMKQPGALFVIFGAVYLIWSCRAGKMPLRAVVSRTAIYLAAAAVPYLLTCLWLWRAGVFQRFWFWTFDYARSYGAHNPPGLVLAALTESIREISFDAGTLWQAGIVGLAAAFFVGARRSKVFAVVLFLCSAAATAAGLCFRTHYFVLMMPAVSLLMAAEILALHKLLQKTSMVSLANSFAAGLMVVIAVLPFIQGHDIFFQLSPTQVSRRIYGNNPFPEAVEIGTYIREHTRPTDTIAVIGSEPEILFESRRRSATGYIYVYSLMENNPWVREMQQEMIDQIEAARPRFLVGVRLHQSWLKTKDSDDHVMQWAHGYIKDHYVPVGYCDLPPSLTKLCASPWTRDALSRRLKPGWGVSILRRKD